MKSAMVTHRILEQIGRVLLIILLILEIIGMFISIIVLASNQLGGYIVIVFLAGLPTIIVTIILIAVAKSLINDYYELESTMYDYFKESKEYTDSKIQQLSRELSGVTSRQAKEIKEIKQANPKTDEPVEEVIEKPTVSKDPEIGDEIILIDVVHIDGKKLAKGSKYKVVNIVYNYGQWLYAVEVNGEKVFLKRGSFEIVDK